MASVRSRAHVRPRVISSVTGEAILLENEIGSLIQEGRRGLVRIIGGPGLGQNNRTPGTWRPFSPLGFGSSAARRRCPGSMTEIGAQLQKR